MTQGQPANQPLGEILSLDIRARLMLQMDQRAAEEARGPIRDEILERAAALGLRVLSFGIKMPSRSGMIRVQIDPNEQGVNIPPRSPLFRQFLPIVRDRHLWLAWIEIPQEQLDALPRQMLAAGRPAPKGKHRSRDCPDSPQ